MQMSDAPEPATPPPRPRIGLAVACLVLGLLAVLSSVVLVGALLALLALVLGGLHIVRRQGSNKLAWAGIAAAVIGLLLSGGFGLLYFKGVQGLWHQVEEAIDREPNDAAATVQRFDDWVGRETPDFTVTALDGETITLSELRGRRVVLDFCATWCPLSRRMVPRFVELAQAHSPDELLVIGISDEDEERLREFVEEQGVNYPVVSAPDLPAPYDSIVYVPTTFIIGRNGVIQAVLEEPDDFEPFDALDFLGQDRPARVDRAQGNDP